MITNSQLVAHAKKALAEEWGYVWGTFGHILTPSLFHDKLIQYPRAVGVYRDIIMSKWLNKRTVDCVGLIKSAMWWDVTDPIYKPSEDLNADMMFDISMEKGPINSIPKDILGLCVWKKGHIGIYVGNDEVIEGRGTRYGVIKSPLYGSGSPGWTHWMKCTYVDYEYKLYLGSYDRAAIKELQKNLNALGHSLVVDGFFGPATEGVVMSLQSGVGRNPTGVVDAKLAKIINDMIKRSNPSKKKTYKDIITEISEQNAQEWITAIDSAVEIAKAKSDLGMLEILQHLPSLIEKIDNNWRMKK